MADGTGGRDQSGGFPWDLILQALGGVAALAAWLTVVGGARVWAWLHAGNIPETQTLAALPKDLYIVVGLQTLLLPLLLGATVAVLVYLSRPLSPARAGVPAPVGSPAAPPPDDRWVLRDWFLRLRPTRVVSDFIGRYGWRPTMVLTGAITVGVTAITLVLADANFGLLAGLIAAAAGVVVLVSRLWPLGPRGAVALFGFLATVAIVVVLWLEVKPQYIAGLLVITLLAGWLTLGLVADKTAGKAALSLFGALALWSGALLFTATAGARDPKLQPARVHLEDRVEQGLLLGRTGDLLLLAQDTETDLERRRREAQSTGSTEPRRRKEPSDTEFERQVLVLADDDIDHVVVGEEARVAITPADEDKEDVIEREAKPGPTAPPPPSTTPTPTPTPAPGPGAGEPEIPPLRDRRVISRADGTIDGVSMQFQVMELARRGAMLVLDARVVSRDDPKRETEGVTIGDAFDDGRRDRHGTGDYSVDGIRLVDPSTSTVYGLARDSRDGCTCTARLKHETVRPGKPFPMVAFFNAPDASSNTVEVIVPGFEVLLDVPVG